MSDYISRQAALDALDGIFDNVPMELTTEILRLRRELRGLSPADVVPYSFAPDGTLTITVPKGTYKKINRVLVEEDGTHWGGLYYAD